MIDRLRLKNFGPYVDKTFYFNERCIVSLCGDVGAGKSKILQGIEYTLFGPIKGRNSSLRRKGTSQMDCVLDFKINNIPYTIMRGVRKDNKGYVYLKESGKNIAINSKVQKKINELLGIDFKLFSLISFFGEDEKDTLIRVPPAKRLDTLLDIAKAMHLIKLGDKVKAKKSETEIELNKVKYSISFLQESLEDEVKINKDIEKKRDLIVQIINTCREIGSRRTACVIEIEKTSSLFSEKEMLNDRLIDTSENVSNEEYDLSVLKKDLKNRKDRLTEFCMDFKSKDELLSSLNNLSDLMDLKEKYEKSLSEFKANLSIYESGLSLKSGKCVDACPLCKSEINQGILDSWSLYRDKLQEDVNLFTYKLNEVKKEISQVNKLTASIEDLKKDILDFELDINMHFKLIEETEKKIVIYKDQINKINIRITNIDRLLDDSKDVKDRLTAIDTELVLRNNTHTKLKCEIRQLESMLDDRSKKVSEIKKLEKQKEGILSTLMSIDLLINAFSRYGVPYTLLSDLIKEISRVASLIYSNFSEGYIEVEEFDYKTYSGVEYYMVDTLGKRAYNELSTGQKMLVGLSVRLAVSEILRDATNIKSDILILDEVVANISDSKKEKLVNLIDKVLSKQYAQIFMTSHVPIKNIFTDSYHVEIKNKKSIVKRL